MENYKIIETDTKEIDDKIYHRIESNHPTVVIGNKNYVACEYLPIIGVNVEIGDNNIFGTGLSIDDNVAIGSNNEFGRSLCIHSNVTIGNNCYLGIASKIYCNVIIGNNVCAKCGVKARSNVKIGDNVVLPVFMDLPDNLIINSGDIKEFKPDPYFMTDFHMVCVKPNKHLYGSIYNMTIDEYKQVRAKYVVNYAKWISKDPMEIVNNEPIVLQIEEFFNS